MDISRLYEIYLKYPQVQTDTRKLQTGDIYFALKGENFDGNQFASKALEAGASYAVIDDEKCQIGDKIILVDDVLKTLQALAHHHRKQLDIPFIAITGSNGKTTTKELMHAVLIAKYTVSATEGNLNNHIGVPLTILKIKADTKIAIIEMGANHLNEIAGYCRIAAPTHGLITNCGKAHLEGFGSLEGVRKAKGELYDALRSSNGTVFINNDLEYLAEMAEGIKHQVSYGKSNADHVGKIFANDPYLEVAVLDQMRECLIRSRLVGAYNFPNIMAAVAVGIFFKVPIDKIKKAIEEYNPGNSRSQLIKRNGQTIILDAYNANPGSMNAAIRNFAGSTYPNKTVMLGAMMELGSDSIEEHQKIIEELQKNNWNHVVLVGGDFKNTTNEYLYFENAVDAAQWLKAMAFQDMAILIKGSRAIAMEKVLN